MTGADEAHLNQVRGQQSRAVTFPDGITRHVTLSNWQWDVFDRSFDGEGYRYLTEAAIVGARRFWLQETFYDAATPYRPSWGVAVEDATACSTERFERLVRRHLVAAISVNMPGLVLGDRHSSAND